MPRFLKPASQVFLPFIFISSFAISSFAHATPKMNPLEPCNPQHPELYSQASTELQQLAAADQADRQGSVGSVDWAKVLPRDLERRVRVATLFAQGCFHLGKDYSAAAMIYQHGEGSDHPFQAFIWAKRALELGEIGENKWLMAAALDRSLVRAGQKQLFATQYSKDTGTSCWCLEPVESTFPDTRRAEYTKKSLSEALEKAKSFDTKTGSCADAGYCRHDLKSSPVGTVPGLW